MTIADLIYDLDCPNVGKARANIEKALAACDGTALPGVRDVKAKVPQKHVSVRYEPATSAGTEPKERGREGRIHRRRGMSDPITGERK